jgi:hypothetical protein
MGTAEKGSTDSRVELSSACVTTHQFITCLQYFPPPPQYLLISSLSFILTHAHFCKFMSIPFSLDLRLILLSQLAFLLCQFKQPLAHAPVQPPSSYFYTAEYLHWALIKFLPKKEAHFNAISNLRKFSIKKL